MKRKFLSALVCLSLLLSLVCLPAGAFSQHENWIDVTEAEVNTMFLNNEAFIVMGYDIFCGKCLTRRTLIERWMTQYDQTVYGLCLNHEQLPYWISSANPTANVTPIVAFVNADHTGFVVSGLLSARQIQNGFDLFAGVYDADGADFSVLNDRMKADRPADEASIRAQYLQEPSPWVERDAAAFVTTETTDYDKAYAIYFNLLLNSFFSYPMEEENAGTRYDVVTVCSTTSRTGNTYALTDYMANLLWAVDIPCRIVKGLHIGNGFNQNVPAVLDLYDKYLADGDLDAFAQGAEPLANHYWLEAWLDGRWVTIDPSMGLSSDSYGNASIRGTGIKSYFDVTEEYYNAFCVSWPEQGQGIQWYWDIDRRDTLHIYGDVSGTAAARTKTTWLGMYDDDGAMLDCAAAPLEDGAFNLTLTLRDYREELAEVKLFLLDNDLSPVRMAYSRK